MADVRFVFHSVPIDAVRFISAAAVVVRWLSTGVGRAGGRAVSSLDQPTKNNKKKKKNKEKKPGGTP